MPTIVSLDGTGRIVLPKPLREQFNLQPGAEFELSAREDCLELRPLNATPALVHRDGLWIHHGVGAAPLAGAVNRLRDDRDRSLARGTSR